MNIKIVPYSLIYIFLLTYLTVSAQNVTVYGKVETPKSKILTFGIARNGLIGETEMIEIELDSQNTFHISITIDKVADLSFKEGERGSPNSFFNFLIEPGDSVSMTYNSKNFWQSLHFIGKGSAKYNYFVEDYLTFEYKHRWRERFDKPNSYPIEEQYAYLDSIETHKLAILNKYKNQITPYAHTICNANIKGDVNSDRFLCISDQRRIDSTYSLMKMPFSLKKFLYRMPNQNDTTANATFYLIYLKTLVRDLYRDQLKIFNQSSKNQYLDFQKSVYSTKVAQYQLGTEVYFQIKQNGINSITVKLLEAYRKDYPDSPYLPILEGRYIKSTLLSNSQKAFPFIVQDEKGNKVKLEDFKGKVVFIDFWASWCVACINEMKNFKKIKEQFKDNKDFVYLTISMDEKEENWHKSLEKWQVEGLRCWAKGAYDSDIAKTYQIGALPVFILIGKDGKFLDVNPPRPRFDGGKPLTELLRQALAK